MRVVPADMFRYATWIFRLPMFLENISEALLAGTYIFLADKSPFPQRRQFEAEVPAAYHTSPRNGLAPHLQQKTAVLCKIPATKYVGHLSHTIERPGLSIHAYKSRVHPVRTCQLMLHRTSLVCFGTVILRLLVVQLCTAACSLQHRPRIFKKRRLSGNACIVLAALVTKIEIAQGYLAVLAIGLNLQAD
jgi:hypothetical protein